jgi:DNA-binding CsgD family transcriptional regulator
MALKEIAAKLDMTESAVGKTMLRLRKEFKAKSNAGMILLLREAKII